MIDVYIRTTIYYKSLLKTKSSHCVTKTKGMEAAYAISDIMYADIIRSTLFMVVCIPLYCIRQARHRCC